MNPIFLILAFALSIIFSLPALLGLNLVVKSDRLFQILGIAIWLALIYPCYLLVEDMARELHERFNA